MRVAVAVLLVLALFGTVAAPSASACSVHVHDPKNPTYSEDCKDPNSWLEPDPIPLSALP